MAPIESYQAFAAQQAEDPQSAFSRSIAENDKRVEACAEQYFGSPSMQKRLKSRQGKQLGRVMLAVVLTDMISVGYGSLGARLSETAVQLDGLVLTDPALAAAAKAGAQKLRLEMELLREPAGGSFACRFLEKAAALKRWSARSLGRTFLASLPRTASERRELTRGLEATERPLKAGAKRMKRMGASRSQLRLFSDFFSLSGSSVTGRSFSRG